MLSVKMILISFVFLVMVISFIFWAISHAPSKKNKTVKKTKMRKWSTILLVAMTEILVFYIGISTPTITIREIVIPAILIGLSFIIIDLSFSMIIKNL